MKTAVTALIELYKGETINERGNFFIMLEGLCDTENTMYILNDLYTLSEVLEEKSATYLIEEIGKYDFQAAKTLEILCD
jgi:hypothetical protein